MTDAEIANILKEIAALRVSIDKLVESTGALKQAQHNPGDCLLNERVALVEKAQAKLTGAFAVIAAGASLVFGLLGSLLLKMLAK